MLALFGGPKESREQDFYLSDIIESDSFVFFHKKSLSPFHWESFKDLSALRIGATRGYTYSTDFWNIADSSNLNKLINLKNFEMNFYGNNYE